MGVVSPDGLLAIQERRVTSSVPWAGITGFKRGRWPWQVRVLTTAHGVNEVASTMNLWTPMLAREFIRIAEEVRKTKGVIKEAAGAAAAGGSVD